jgi:NADH:ubiquinone oxidoreductase subunit 4 (subunit M)
VLSAGYYLYVVMVMFMRPRAADARPIAPLGGLTNGVIVATVALILVFGFAPSQLLRRASSSALDRLVPAAGLPLAPAPAAVPAGAGAAALTAR